MAQNSPMDMAEWLEDKNHGEPSRLWFQPDTPMTEPIGYLEAL